MAQKPNTLLGILITEDFKVVDKSREVSCAGIISAAKHLGDIEIGMRNFYHNFPRSRPEDSRDQMIEKGLQILKSVKDIGLILAPEHLVWKQPLVDGTSRTTENLQNRICFTELEQGEVSEHGKKFGPFSIEFEIATLRCLGILPVIYIPQNIYGDKNLGSVGTTIVTQLADARYTMKKLHELSQLSDPAYILKHIAPSATNVDENLILNLRNVDYNNSVVQEFPVSIQAVRCVLNYVGFRNSPFELMTGVLDGVQSLFYPTDDIIHQESLSYYRQREWRLIAGLSAEGTAQSRLLKGSEKSRLLEIDARFWSREISTQDSSFQRIDRTYVITEFEGNPIHELISKVMVPSAAEEKAVEIFGDKVIIEI